MLRYLLLSCVSATVSVADAALSFGAVELEITDGIWKLVWNRPLRRVSLTNLGSDAVPRAHALAQAAERESRFRVCIAERSEAGVWFLQSSSAILI